MMKKRMCGKKVLLVLDDVDHIDQLEALVSQPNSFKTGSRIIITTRDEQVLVAHKVFLIRVINLLSYREAICLFSRYAFGKDIPSQGYEELSEKVVRYADGLPLTVKVLGSFLCGKDKLEWVDAIERLEQIPLKETLKQLEISYSSLEDDYKEMFLDIACILKGERREYAIRVLECCGFHARNGVKVLEQRSLITSYFEDLGMHDHIEEMGKNIVRRSNPDEPNKHSRLWINEEIEDILANDKGTEETRCLKLDMSRGNSIILLKGLGKMKKLRYLAVHFAVTFNWESDGECLGSDPKFDDTIQYFTNSLKYLECINYPFLYLPKIFQADNLVGLEMKGGKMVQLWKEGNQKVLKKLKYIYLYKSNLTTFDFGMTPNLKTLSLESPRNFVEVRMPISCQKLSYVDISYPKFRIFDLGLTPNLETLYLRYSYDLVGLCMPVTCQKLKHLDSNYSKLTCFDLTLTPNLETLSLVNCAYFVHLHVSVACPNLKILTIHGSRLRSLDLELIPNLERLDLQRCHELVEIKAPVGCLNKAVYLIINGCALLKKLPEHIGMLKSAGHNTYYWHKSSSA